MADEIIRELWQIKDAIAREFDYNVEALVAHLRSAESRSDRTVVDLHLPARRAEPGASPDAAAPRR
jgi:hypothetical protein